MEVRYSTQFKKQYKKLSKKIRLQFHERLALLMADQDSPQLHIHKLSGEYLGLWSMNVTGEMRAIFDCSYKGVAVFVAIGSHSKLYS
jgi:addiction module RelE/StbE family toxin